MSTMSPLLRGRSGSRFGLQSLLAYLVLTPLFLFFSVTHASHHDHGHAHQAHHDLFVRRANADAPSVPALAPRDSLVAAYALFNASLPKIAAANRLKLQQPRFNTRQFPPGNGVGDSGVTNMTTGGNSTIPVIGRRGVNGTSSTGIGSAGSPSAGNTTSRDYILSADLVAAARLIAEAMTITPASKGYTDKAAALKAQYWGEYATTNETDTDTNDIHKRASSYWMESMTMNGVAPYATASGYKVWRNVLDYGAKGDGKTDDTAAINRAITDGGRCGQACGSSSATPAVIYFPSGTYLVSDTLVMYYNTQFLGDVSCCPVSSLSFVFLFFFFLFSSFPFPPSRH